MNPAVKRKYNLTYKAKKAGIIVDGRRHAIIIYFDEILLLIRNPSAVSLITDFNFKVTENRQLKLFKQTV